MLLGNSQDADSSLWLAQVVVDADEGLHCRLWAALVLQLLVVQGLGKRVALLCQGTQRPVQCSRESTEKAELGADRRGYCTLKMTSIEEGRWLLAAAFLG